MAKTFRQEGDALELTPPVGGVVGDGAYMIGSLLVIAAGDVSAADAVLGAKFTGVPVYVWTVAKPDQEAWTEGEKIYFDESTSPVPLFTSVIGSPELPLVGAATAAVPLSLILDTDNTESPPSVDLDADAGTIQVVGYADLGGNTITVTVNGVETVLTEGVDFTAETSDDETASNLGDALALIPGITVEVVTDTVTITVTNPSTTGRVRLDGAVR